ncbi:Glutathione S-transferase U1 [Perkinsus chesapeaki]|uniref:Glutathione S-transferase U1 n=1 Tax=Perkinsus chesapeaki TaxID=330153 RepID=A0A7J6MPV8_PERCH|nr:Glutathione S-transferase U1 [Perkinsus chesapeaki]
MSLPEGAPEYKLEPLLLEKNPKGVVPVIVAQWPDGKEEIITESIDCVEYLDKLGENAGLGAPPLVPRTDEAGRTKIREAAEKHGASMGTFMKALMKFDSEAVEKMVEEFEQFSDESKGPFYTGDNLSLVDITVYPVASRLTMLQKLRGPDFAVTLDKYPQLEDFFRWLQKMSELDAVKKATEPDAYLVPVHLRHLKVKHAVGF